MRMLRLFYPPFSLFDTTHLPFSIAPVDPAQSPYHRPITSSSVAPPLDPLPGPLPVTRLASPPLSGID